MHIYMFIYVHICVCVCIYTYIHIYVYIDSIKTSILLFSFYIYTHRCIYISIHTHAHIYTHTYTHINIYTIQQANDSLASFTNRTFSRHVQHHQSMRMCVRTVFLMNIYISNSPFPPPPSFLTHNDIYSSSEPFSVVSFSTTSPFFQNRVREEDSKKEEVSLL